MTQRKYVFDMWSLPLVVFVTMTTGRDSAKVGMKFHQSSFSLCTVLGSNKIHQANLSVSIEVRVDIEFLRYV